MQSWKGKTLCILALLVFLAACPALAEEKEKNVPDLAGLTLTGTEGETALPEEWTQENTVVLAALFRDAQDCADVLKQFQELCVREEIQGFGISLDSPENLRALKEQEELTIALYTAEDEDILNWLDPDKSVTWLVKAADGTVQAAESLEEIEILLKTLKGSSPLTSQGLGAGLISRQSSEENTAYTVLVVDQAGEPVAGVFVNVCTDTFCMPYQTDQEGRITFTGEKEIYHLKIIKAPEGYGYNPDEEMYIGGDQTEMTLTVQKDESQ